MAGEFPRQSLGRTIFGLNPSIPETSRSSVQTCTWAIWRGTVQFGGHIWTAQACSCSTVPLAGQFLVLISLLTWLSTSMQSLEDAVPTLFLSGLKYLFGKSGHCILLTWIWTLLYRRRTQFALEKMDWIHLRGWSCGCCCPDRCFGSSCCTPIYRTSGHPTGLPTGLMKLDDAHYMQLMAWIKILESRYCTLLPFTGWYCT